MFPRSYKILVNGISKINLLFQALAVGADYDGDVCMEYIILQVKLFLQK